MKILRGFKTELDLNNKQKTAPPLTTIAPPKKEIGVQAVSLFVERITQNSRPPKRLVLPPELIIRRSTQSRLPLPGQ